MNERRLSEPFGMAMPIIGWITIGIGIVTYLVSFNLLTLVFVLIGLIFVVLTRKMKDVSYDDEYLIVRSFLKKERMDLRKIRKIYKSYVGLNYTIELLGDENNSVSIDFWPKTNIFRMMAGRLPENLEELLKKIS